MTVALKRKRLYVVYDSFPGLIVLAIDKVLDMSLDNDCRRLLHHIPGAPMFCHALEMVLDPVIGNFEVFRDYEGYSSALDWRLSALVLVFEEITDRLIHVCGEV